MSDAAGHGDKLLPLMWRIYEGGIGMGVYLPNMEMPKPGEVIRIYNNGEARRCPVAEQKAFEVGIAVPVPPHGRLVDADALLQGCERVQGEYAIREYAFSQSAIENAPTIIPAEEGE